MPIRIKYIVLLLILFTSTGSLCAQKHKQEKKFQGHIGIGAMHFPTHNTIYLLTAQHDINSRYAYQKDVTPYAEVGLMYKKRYFINGGYLQGTHKNGLGGAPVIDIYRSHSWYAEAGISFSRNKKNIGFQFSLVRQQLKRLYETSTLFGISPVTDRWEAEYDGRIGTYLGKLDFTKRFKYIQLDIYMAIPFFESIRSGYNYYHWNKPLPEIGGPVTEEYDEGNINSHRFEPSPFKYLQFGLVLSYRFDL